MARNEETLAFAQRLRQALGRSAKRIETPAELALQFNLHHTGSQITNQAAQKWLAGASRPSPEKFATLAKMLDVSAQWLRYGIPETRPDTSRSTPVASTDRQPTAPELALLSRYRLLTAYQQDLIADLIEQLALDREMWASPAQTGDAPTSGG